MTILINGLKQHTVVIVTIILTVSCANESHTGFEGMKDQVTAQYTETEQSRNPIPSNTQNDNVQKTKNSGLQKTVGVIEFSGVINKQKSSKVTAYIKELFLKKNVNEFIIYINSDGGDSDASIAIYQSLKALPISITTVNSGTVGSGAVWFYCSGDKRYSMPNSSFMIHGSTTSNATINSGIQLEGYIKLYEKFYKAQKYILKSCSTMSYSLIDKYIKSSDQKYLTADEAMNVGIVQELGSPDYKKSKDITYEVGLISDNN